MFEGNLLEHLNQIKDEATCQMACQHVPACKYYVWDKDQKDCQLLDSGDRTCDMVKGISKNNGNTKDWADCKDKFPNVKF